MNLWSDTKAQLWGPHPESPRDGGYCVPRILVDVVAARPINLQIMHGIESVVGGRRPLD
jgi:hypothetical protein